MRGCSKKHQGLCGKMWRRLKEGNGWEEAFAMKGEAEKKPSSQKQLSMTVRGQTTGEDPEHSHSAALTVNHFSFPLQLKLSENPNKLNVHQLNSHWASGVEFGFLQSTYYIRVNAAAQPPHKENCSINILAHEKETPS